MGISDMTLTLKDPDDKVLDRKRFVIGAIFLVLIMTGCTATPELNARMIWDRAETRRHRTNRAFEIIKAQRNDYTAISRLSNDNNLRGLAFYRLANLDMAGGYYGRARENLKKSLLCGASAKTNRQVLLRLADLLDRYLHDAEQAQAVYARLIAEYPDSLESELGKLRLDDLKHADKQ